MGRPISSALTTGTKANFLKGRNQRHLKIHRQYHGVSVSDIYMLMTPTEVAFCEEYERTDCNASEAAFRACFASDFERFKSEKARQQTCSTKGMTYLKKPIVSTYLYKKRRKMLELHEKRMQRSFDAYVDKMEEIRDSALGDGDYGAAFRTHQALGVIHGHTDSDADRLTKQSDSDLIRQIAGTNAQLAQALAKQLGVQKDEVIEGEVVPDQ